MIGRSLYFTDIRRSMLLRYNVDTGEKIATSTQDAITCFGPMMSADTILVATIRGLQVLSLEGHMLTPFVSVEETRPNIRCNDGAAAPDGSFWFGTMDDRETYSRGGNWYRYGADTGALSLLDLGYHVPNGPAFSPSGQSVFLTDSARRTIYQADLLDQGRGLINKRIWRMFQADQGAPDGMAFDDQGLLWIAFWDGSCVRAFTEDGDLVHDIQVPAKRPTSIAFDPGTRSLFVTSATSPSGGAPSGALYRIQLTD